MARVTSKGATKRKPKSMNQMCREKQDRRTESITYTECKSLILGTPEAEPALS